MRIVHMAWGQIFRLTSESWKGENTQLPKSIYVNCCPTNSKIHQSFTIKFVSNSGMSIL